MTRRSDKQEEHAWYVADGNVGEVWIAWGIDWYGGEDSLDLKFLDAFSTEQTANQYAEWWHKNHGGRSDAPRATKQIIRTKMRKWEP